MTSSLALPVVACVLLLAASGDAEAEHGIEADNSWDMGYDRWDKHDGLVNGLPKVSAKGQGIAETAGDHLKLGEAGVKHAAPIDCRKAHVANQFACYAYGEHSPVCTGSQTQYVLKCGSQPKTLYKMKKGLSDQDQHTAFLALLQEQTGMVPPTALVQLGEGNGNASNSTNTTHYAAHLGPKPQDLKTLKEILEPMLIGCQRHHDEAKAACKKSISDGYIAFKANPGGEELAEDDSVEKIDEKDLGSDEGVDRIYKQAMRAYNAQRRQRKMHTQAEDDVSAAAKFAEREAANPSAYFDRIDPMKAQQDVQAFAGDSLMDDEAPSTFGPY